MTAEAGGSVAIEGVAATELPRGLDLARGLGPAVLEALKPLPQPASSLVTALALSSPRPAPMSRRPRRPAPQAAKPCAPRPALCPHQPLRPQNGRRATAPPRHPPSHQSQWRQRRFVPYGQNSERGPCTPIPVANCQPNASQPPRQSINCLQLTTEHLPHGTSSSEPAFYRLATIPTPGKQRMVENLSTVAKQQHFTGKLRVNCTQSGGNSAAPHSSPVIFAEISQVISEVISEVIFARSFSPVNFPTSHPRRSNRQSLAERSCKSFVPGPSSTKGDQITL